jgi:hypothetical protein
MKYIKSVLLLVIICNVSILFAKIPTIGLMQHLTGSLDDGYILYTQLNNKQTYLIDKCGYLINQWESAYKPGFAVYLLPNGNLLRAGNIGNDRFPAGGSGGIIELLDWESNILWSYKLSTFTQCSHHDFKSLPNGNILMIVWDKKSEAEATALGRKTELIDSFVWNEKIIEIKPIGKDSAEVVWEWSAWDHLVQDKEVSKPNFDIISSRPERININYADEVNKIDWLHINSVDYNPEFDQILLSVLYFNEIWVIDHSTTTSQARTSKGGKYGKGGDLLYRWGNPYAYGKGSVSDQKLFLQHDAYWIPEGMPEAGKIMVFNNCRGTKQAPYSSVDIIETPVSVSGEYGNTLPYGPENTYWSYTAPNPQAFYAMNLSSGQMLPNGNALICNGFTGDFFELDTNKETVWEYINPVGPSGPLTQGSKAVMNLVFRCTFYPSSYSAFSGKELLQIGLIEKENENSANCQLVSVNDTPEIKKLVACPNPADNQINLETDYPVYSIEIIDVTGAIVLTAENTKTVSTNTLPNGTYYINLISESGEISSNKFIISR